MMTYACPYWTIDPILGIRIPCVLDEGHQGEHVPVEYIPPEEPEA